MPLTRVCLVYSTVNGVLLRIIVSDDHPDDVALMRVHVHEDEGGLMVPYEKFARELSHEKLEAMVQAASGITPPPREAVVLIDQNNKVVQIAHDRFGLTDRGDLREVRLTDIDSDLDHFGRPVHVSGNDHLLPAGDRWKLVVDSSNVRPPPPETESL